MTFFRKIFCHLIFEKFFRGRRRDSIILWKNLCRLRECHKFSEKFPNRNRANRIEFYKNLLCAQCNQKNKAGRIIYPQFSLFLLLFVSVKFSSQELLHRNNRPVYILLFLTLDEPLLLYLSS